MVTSIVAYDLTMSMLKQVERLASDKGVSNVITQQGDVHAMPFADGTFDLIVSRYSAHHWSNPTSALREIHRVLKPGRHFLLSDIVAPASPVVDTYLQAIELLRDPSHVRDHSVHEWLSMLTGVGFAAGKDITWRLPLDFDAWVVRMATPMAQVQMIKTLLDNAPHEVREMFAVQQGYAFVLDGALLVAQKYLE
jgi:SAM-dependent methyltransferase